MEIHVLKVKWFLSYKLHKLEIQENFIPKYLWSSCTKPFCSMGQGKI